MMSLSLGRWRRETAGPGSRDTRANSFTCPLTHLPTRLHALIAAYPAAGTAVAAIMTARIGPTWLSSG